MTLILLAILLAAEPSSAGALESLPLTGRAVEGLQSYERVLGEILREWDIPGAAVAVTRNGRLVYARGLGYADRQRQVAVQPESLFRIASLSKPITAVSVLKLVEQKRLGIDDSVFELLSRAGTIPADAPRDPRWCGITVRHLLQHSGGFDRDVSGDPMFKLRQIADALAGLSPSGPPEGERAPLVDQDVPPADTGMILRYMLGQPLDFDPGTRYAYSNFGYSVLGRVIEAVTGKSYEEYVRGEVLAPMGIHGMRLGRSSDGQRAAGEVQYYGHQSVTAGGAADSATPLRSDGWFYLEPLDAHGGWIASAVDLARFLAHCDGRPCPPDLLDAQTLALMTARPAFSPDDAPSWYGLGWSVRPAGSDQNWWHMGSMPGTASLMVRAHNGLSWAVLLNRRDSGRGGLNGTVDRRMWEAAAEVERWPEGDLFEKYDSSND